MMIHAKLGKHIFMVRLGILGCGFSTEVLHLQNLKSLVNVEIVAVADINVERRNWISQQLPSATVFEHYKDLLNKCSDIDAVLIALPTLEHVPAAILAIERGLHIYLEKPISLTLENAQHLLHTWQKTDLVAMMGLNFRYSNQFSQAREAIQNKTIGDVVAIRTRFTKYIDHLADWRLSLATGGGVLMEDAPHHIDFLHYVLREKVVSVYAIQESKRFAGDAVTLVLKTETGKVMTSILSQNTLDEQSIEVLGTEGVLFSDVHKMPVLDIQKRASGFGRMGQLLFRAKYLHPQYWLSATGRNPSFRIAMQTFISAIEAKQSIYPNLLDGYATCVIQDAARQSIMSGQVVHIEDSIYQTLYRL